MIIDCHTHILPPRVRERREDYLRRDRGFAELYSSPRARLATAEELIASMDKAGIAAAVVLGFAWSEQALCQESNEYILDSAVRYPGRLLPFICLQPRAGEEALRELERCVQAGARGLGELRPYAQDFDLTDPSLDPIMERARELQMPLLLHASEPVGHLYPGKGTTTPALLYPFLQHHREQAIILAHWGGGLPFYALMPEVKATLQNAYVDTAASSLLYDSAIFRLAPPLIGPSRILWGSDYPLLRQAPELTRARDALPPRIRAAVLGGNAARLLKLQAGYGKSAS
ncbi:MAG: amidohydrolase [Dehalococcoidia bacterium]|nr:amidohydrolase [Dehalococcoidia bacterium]